MIQESHGEAANRHARARQKKSLDRARTKQKIVSSSTRSGGFRLINGIIGMREIGQSGSRAKFR
jgi:hypothetical protein